ncbi:uncharacterized protein BX663DRAFT_494694 [Cokeromyces recurvatus]|uniref:uncharacterized protein n=1 Tax=Cokeromyces recurvatus TaxID=90255 RepID=UPI00221EBBA2|nr:uncharacterized protein BX663DRAFT_494694 [Cokeromyces recurvatus]KAI7907063.1 hypothetical protein BX663DRAFT_494694 [Cokeromyces recurvatus]
MRSALTLSTRRAKSSQCLLKQRCFELERFHKRLFMTTSIVSSKRLPLTSHGPRLRPILWYLVTRPLSTQPPKREEEEEEKNESDLVELGRQFHPRTMSKCIDLDGLLNYLQMAKDTLGEKKIFKTLRTALYNTYKYDAQQAWSIYQAMVEHKVDMYLNEHQYGHLLDILKHSKQPFAVEMLTVLENMKTHHAQEGTTGEKVYPTVYHITQVLYGMGQQGRVKEAYDLIRAITATAQSTNRTDYFPTTNHYHSLATALKNSYYVKHPVWIKRITRFIIEGMKERSTALDDITVTLVVHLLTSRNHFKQFEGLTLEFLNQVEEVNNAASKHDDDHHHHHHQRRHHHHFNVYVYTSLIIGFARQGNLEVAKNLFKEMRKYKIEPTEITFGAMMEAYGISGDFVGAKGLLKEYRRRHERLSNPIATSLLVNAIRHRQFKIAEETAEMIFKDIKLEDQDTRLRTALIWYKTKQDVEKAREEFDRLYQHDTSWVNSIMVNHLVGGYGAKGDKAKVVEAFDLHRQLEPDQVIKGRAKHYLTHALFQCRDVPAALSVFASLRSEYIPDSITLAMVIQGLVMNNEGNLAWQLFKSLQSEGIEPNQRAYTSIIKALAHRDSDLRKAKYSSPSSHLSSDILRDAGIHSQADFFHSSVPATTEAMNIFRRLTGFTQPHIYTYTTLISCFAKHDLKQAIAIFDHMCEHHVKPTVEVYTALIQGCAIFKDAKTAVIIYQHMSEQQIQPNAVTWRYLLKSMLRSHIDRKDIDKIGEIARECLLKDDAIDEYQKLQYQKLKMKIRNEKLREKNIIQKDRKERKERYREQKYKKSQKQKNTIPHKKPRRRRNRRKRKARRNEMLMYQI